MTTLERQVINALDVINGNRLLGTRRELDADTLPDGLLRELERAECRLAIYGTLAPGRENHHEIEHLAGSWTSGSVRGRLYREGWGAALGAPAMVWDPAAAPVTVMLLDSRALPAEWPRLDTFEGDEYLRVLVPVETSTEIRIANLYAARRMMEAVRRDSQ